MNPKYLCDKYDYEKALISKVRNGIISNEPEICTYVCDYDEVGLKPFIKKLLNEWKKAGAINGFAIITETKKAPKKPSPISLADKITNPEYYEEAHQDLLETYHEQMLEAGEKYYCAKVNLEKTDIKALNKVIADVLGEKYAIPFKSNDIFYYDDLRMRFVFDGQRVDVSVDTEYSKVIRAGLDVRDKHGRAEYDKILGCLKRKYAFPVKKLNDQLINNGTAEFLKRAKIGDDRLADISCKEPIIITREKKVLIFRKE